ncbi:hypothetical protein ACHQM5_009184 [Ranunculus cassubicifolius]
MKLKLHSRPSSISIPISPNPCSKSPKTISRFPLNTQILHFSLPQSKHLKPISSINKDQSDCSNRLQFIRHKKLLSDLSTWGIGGICNYFIQVTTISQLISAVRYCNDNSVRFLIVGKGSNCLFDDQGFDGCVILNRIEFIQKIEPGLYRVGSGYPFNRLGVQSCNEGFSGLEFAGGIPGTVGGATYMNAGANGQETADIIDSVEFVSNDGRYRTLNRNDLTFSYRRSSFQDMDDLAAIITVTFCLTPSATAKSQQQTYLARRRLTQPVGERSAGSVFQNPLGFSAGELIEKVGLKGHRVGGAKISDIHANFFINIGNSTSKDMLKLINLAKEKVNSKFGIQLNEEVRYINSCNSKNSNTLLH